MWVCLISNWGFWNVRSIWSIFILCLWCISHCDGCCIRSIFWIRTIPLVICHLFSWIIPPPTGICRKMWHLPPSASPTSILNLRADFRHLFLFCFCQLSLTCLFSWIPPPLSGTTAFRQAAHMLEAFPGVAGLGRWGARESMRFWRISCF